MTDGVSKRCYLTSSPESNLWTLHVVVSETRVRSFSFEEFLAGFSPHDLVANGVKVAQRIKFLIKAELREVDNVVANRQCTVSFDENKRHFNVCHECCSC